MLSDSVRRVFLLRAWLAPSGLRLFVSMRRRWFDLAPVSPRGKSFGRRMVERRSVAGRPSSRAALVLGALTLVCRVEAKPAALSSEPALRDAVSFQASRERARHYFVQGGQAASRGAWKQAIDVYLESYVHFPHPSTLHNIGRCYYELGDTYRAVFFTARALYEPPSDGVAGLSEASRARAREQLSELFDQLGRVTLRSIQELPGPVSVQVDDVQVSVVPLGDGSGFLPLEHGGGGPVMWRSQDVLLLEPGIHRVRVTFGEQSQVVPVEVKTVRHTVIGLDPWRAVEPGAMLDASPGKAQVAPYTSARHAPTTPEPDSSPATPLYYLALGSWAVSAASLGVALAAGLDAKAVDDDLTRRCVEGRCSALYADDIARYDAAVMTSYVGLGVGAIAAAVGGTLWLLDERRSGSSLALSVGARHVSLNARF